MPYDLIGLAALLHRQGRSCQAIAEASADPQLAELALADAKLFQSASDIIKKAADDAPLSSTLHFAARTKVVSRDTRRGRSLVSDTSA